MIITFKAQVDLAATQSIDARHVEVGGRQQAALAQNTNGRGQVRRGGVDEIIESDGHAFVAAQHGAIAWSAGCHGEVRRGVDLHALAIALHDLPANAEQLTAGFLLLPVDGLVLTLSVGFQQQVAVASTNANQALLHLQGHSANRFGYRAGGHGAALNGLHAVIQLCAKIFKAGQVQLLVTQKQHIQFAIQPLHIHRRTEQIRFQAAVKGNAWQRRLRTQFVAANRQEADITSA